MKRKVLLIYTGGTIGMEKNYETGSLEPFDFEHIFSRLPEINLLHCQVSVRSFENPMDSSDVGPEAWRKIANCISESYHQFDGFIVLHGTDTMAYTSSILSFMLKGLRKPVILTGSQLPIGELRTDAKENLLTSLYYASLYEGEQAIIQEVAIYFQDKLFRGNRTLKHSAELFDAYQSPNYPILGRSGVHLNVHKNALFRPFEKENFNVDTHLSTQVLFLRIFPGMCWENLSNFQNIKVLILQVFGSGTIFNNEVTKNKLLEIRKNGTEIVVISQCVSGEITFGKYENSNVFSEIGAINGKDMTVEAALAKAMHLVENKNYNEDFKILFSKNLRGEMSETNKNHSQEN